MPWLHIIWSDANIAKIEVHDLTRAEVEYVLQHPLATDISRTSERPIHIGRTHAGRSILVVFEWIDDVTVYPITAYDIQE